MPPQTVVARVVKLEEEMSALRELPAQVSDLASQVLHLRGEMRAEFSAIREELRSGDDQLRAEIRAGDEETRNQLRAEIREGDEETRRQMRVLHEDVVGRIALLQEGLGGRRKTR